MTRLAIITLACIAFVANSTDAAPPYKDDPAIIKRIKALPANTGWYLPKVKALHDGKSVNRPTARDYSNKMPYMEDRHTAFYCGGGHAHRRYNDAWEFHLGSNTWHLLFPAEGGDQGKTKGGWFVMGQLIRDPKKKLTEKQKQNKQRLHDWWKKHMVLRDGYLQTHRGGGFMTSHTWDGITYDPLTRKLLWAGGHNKTDDWMIHAMFQPGYTPQRHDEFIKKIKAKVRLGELSNMWYFDFEKKRWFRQSNKGYKPATTGGGATFHYIPDLKKSLYHSAIYRRTATALYDGVNNKWIKLKPNGMTVGQLRKNDLAPRSEQQVAYSEQHKQLVAVIQDKTYAYDVRKNTWRKLKEGSRHSAHDARTVFDYDSANDRFILMFPRKNLLRAYSLKTNTWETLKPKGDAFKSARYDPGRGYYDPRLNVFVCIQGDRTWVYRYGNGK